MSTVTTASHLGREFRAICGAEYVVENPPELRDKRIAGLPAAVTLTSTPGVAVTPGSADEIVAILRFANEHGLNVVPVGGFTQQHIGNVQPQADVLLYTTRLTELEHYDPGDLTIGIGAGRTVAQLCSLVAADHLCFAADPPLPERCTVGGLLATGMNGPHRHGYGGLRDYCIGVRFVTGDARKAKGGGRVVKNVAGYDMMKLLIGSQGTLAVITSASFKLFPAPRQTRTFVAEFSSAVEAIEFRDRVLHSPLSPMGLELVSPEAKGVLRPEMADSKTWAVCLRAAGSDAVLARYRTELGAAVTREVEGQNEHDLWMGLADFSHLAYQQRPNSLQMSIALPVREVGRVLNDAASVAESNSFTFAAIGRIGVGHLLMALWPAPGAEGTLENFVNALSGLRDRLSRNASMAVLRCPPEARHHVTAWGPTPTDLESMRTVKLALDPKDILNRGRFLV